MEYEIRRLRREELGRLKDMCDEQHWNVSLKHLQDCYDLNPHYYCATSGGRLLSFCGWLPLGGSLENKTAWVVTFITQPEHRGKGIGKKVFFHCLASAGDVNIGLASAADKKGMYQAWGFQHEGLSVTSYVSQIKSSKREATTVKDVKKVRIEDILKYDSEHICPISREVHLGMVLLNSLVFKVAVRDGKVVGYGGVCKGSEYYQLNPLYADDEVVAQALMNELIKAVPSEEMIEAQVPIDNKMALDLFESYGMERGGFTSVHLFTKEVIRPLKVGKVYAIMDYDFSIA